MLWVFFNHKGDNGFKNVKYSALDMVSILERVTFIAVCSCPCKLVLFTY